MHHGEYSLANFLWAIFWVYIFIWIFNGDLSRDIDAAMSRTVNAIFKDNK